MDAVSCWLHDGLVTIEAAPRVGVGVVIRRGGQLLLQRRLNVHGEGTWSTPGGHLDFGESPVDCAVREAAEETGLRIASPRFLGVTNDVFDQTPLQRLLDGMLLRTL